MKDRALMLDEAYERLFAGLAGTTGWKLLKSRHCLKTQVGDLVFQLNFYFSKYNRAEEYIVTQADFRLWYKAYGKACNANTIVASVPYRKKDGGWYDITTEGKLTAVLADLAGEIGETAVELHERFLTDEAAALESLAGEDFFRFNVSIGFIEDRLGRQTAERLALASYERAIEPVKRQFAAFMSDGTVGGWLRNHRNYKYIAEHGLLPSQLP